jgi:hypothetical protein
LYGGAGGGGGNSGLGTSLGASGAQGIIVITYQPVGPVARPSMLEFWGGFFRQQGGQVLIYVHPTAQ